MPFPLQLTQPEYETLAALARAGARYPEQQHDLERFLIGLEKEAGITRHSLLVQWEELNQPLPPGIRFPKQWPPQQRHQINLLDRPVAQVDVEEMVAALGKQPTNILVTNDPAGLVGWTALSVFFIR